MVAALTPPMEDEEESKKSMAARLDAETRDRREHLADNESLLFRAEAIQPI